MVDDSTLCSIRNIIDYMYDNEKWDYETCEKENQDNHIFTHVKNVKGWLNDITGYIVERCPKCRALTYEIHGEGELSDGRHYPLDGCTACGYSWNSAQEQGGDMDEEKDKLN